MASFTGKTLGHYLILEQLGGGGMAIVYKARDIRLERDVAVKVIRVDQFPPASLGRVLKRFEREAETLAKLSHPSIVSLIDFGEYETVPYLVMPLVQGGTLKHRIKRGAITWQEAVRLVKPVAEALDFAHQRGVIHRDVKPSNILIAENGTPMLSDFGVAKVFESEGTADLTGMAMGVGTPEYMAPEQWTGQSTPQSDIYSLGVVFYELLTGRKPYTADTPAAVMLMQATEPLPPPTSFVAGIPEQVERVLLKSLALRREDRFQTMGDFLAALSKLEGAVFEHDELPTVDVLAPPPETMVKERSSPRNSLWLKVGLFVTTLLVVTGIMVAFSSQMGLFSPTDAQTITSTSTETSSPTQTSTPTKSPTTTPTPSITPTPEPTAFGGGGRIGFVSDQSGQSHLYVMNLNEEFKIFSLTNEDIFPGGIQSAAWAPDGFRVAFMSRYAGSAQLFTMDTNGENLKSIAESPTIYTQLDWSPDGKNVFYYFTKDYSLKTFYDGSQTKVLQMQMIRPVWTRNGSKVVFHTSTGLLCGFPLYYMEENNHDFKKIIDQNGRCGPYTWSAMGDKLFYIFMIDDSSWGRIHSSSSLYSIDLDGTNNQEIIELDFFPYYMFLSPDGKKLLFSYNWHRFSEDFLKFGVYTMNIDGTDLIRLNDRASEYAIWSPDGTKILFVGTSSPGLYDLFITNADGTEIRNITNQPANYRYPAWLP